MTSFTATKSTDLTLLNACKRPNPLYLHDMDWKLAR